MLNKDYKIIEELQKILNSRKSEMPENSYVSLLFKKGNSEINSVYFLKLYFSLFPFYNKLI